MIRQDWFWGVHLSKTGSTWGASLQHDFISNILETQYRGVARGGGGGPEPEPFGRSVNPIQTRGEDYAPHTTAIPHPRIQKTKLHLCEFHNKQFKETLGTYVYFVTSVKSLSPPFLST